MLVLREDPGNCQAAKLLLDSVPPPVCSDCSNIADAMPRLNLDPTSPVVCTRLCFSIRAHTHHCCCWDGFLLQICAFSRRVGMSCGALGVCQCSEQNFSLFMCCHNPRRLSMHTVSAA